MSTGRSNTSSKRKKSTPQKFKSRRPFVSARHDLLESEFIQPRDEEVQENQLNLSKLPVTFQNKENMPEECPNGSVTTPRGRGRPKGSKNKNFPTLPTKVYAVRKVRSRVYASKAKSNIHGNSQSRDVTVHRGRGRPKGSTKVKPDEDIPKRSRGRPKGSRNKTQLKIYIGENKIGRGRPRKTPRPYHIDENMTPKRGRGRPKGSVKRGRPAKRLSLMSETLEVRKRGRPKKIFLHHSALMPLSPKRPRGRPKKEHFAEVPSHEFAPMLENFEVRKRGRPKKIILQAPLKSLTPKRPRGRPSKNSSFSAVQCYDDELKNAESNTDEEEDIIHVEHYDEEEDEMNDNDNRGDEEDGGRDEEEDGGRDEENGGRDEEEDGGRDEEDEDDDDNDDDK